MQYSIFNASTILLGIPCTRSFLASNAEHARKLARDYWRVNDDHKVTVHRDKVAAPSPKSIG